MINFIFVSRCKNRVLCVLCVPTLRKRRQINAPVGHNRGTHFSSDTVSKIHNLDCVPPTTLIVTGFQSLQDTWDTKDTFLGIPKGL